VAKIGVVHVPYYSHINAATRLTAVLAGQGHDVIAWALGIVAFLVVTALTGPDLFLRVELGSIAGAAASAAMMAWMLIPRMREGIGADSLTELVEQIEHEPIEI